MYNLGSVGGMLVVLAGYVVEARDGLGDGEEPLHLDLELVKAACEKVQGKLCASTLGRKL